MTSQRALRAITSEHVDDGMSGKGLSLWLLPLASGRTLKSQYGGLGLVRFFTPKS